MKTYQFNTPPAVPGIYVVRHKPSDRLYIGRSLDLARRYQEWKTVFRSHLGVKSSEILKLLEGSTPEDWEFGIIAELPGATDDTLADYEERAVTRVGNKSPARLLNTLNPAIPRKQETATSPKSAITRGGTPVPYSEAARVLGCTVKQVQKRMARWRAKGVYTVAVEDLKTLTEKYRAV